MHATYSTSQFIYTSLQSPTHHDKRQSEQNQEMEITLHSLSYPKLPKPPSCSTPSSSPPLFHSSVTFLGFNRLPTNLQSNLLIKPKQQRKFGVVHASEAQSTSPDDGEKWLLEPVGDGDSRHIGFKVALPGALEISSGVVTVGRVPEKADVVIPVATVSALHARIQKKEGSLLVTDLDSTNGTFIDDKRLSPGVATTVSPGRCITFGDTNLAMFRVLKLENTKASGEAVESESEIGAAVPSNNAESTS